MNWHLDFLRRLFEKAVPSRILFWRYFLPLFFYFIFIIFLTLRPQDAFPDIQIPFVDKLAHFLIYFGLAFLVSRFLSSGLRRQNLLKVISVGFVLGGLYGALDEFFIQTLAPDRNTEWADFVANLVGSAFGASFTTAYLKMKRLYRERLLVRAGR